MALTQEEVLQFTRGHGEVPEEMLTAFAQEVFERIQNTKPEEIEPGTMVIHPANIKFLEFLEYRGGTVLVRGYPGGDLAAGLTDFEVPSDEIFVASLQP